MRQGRRFFLFVRRTTQKSPTNLMTIPFVRTGKTTCGLSFANDDNTKCNDDDEDRNASARIPGKHVDGHQT